MPGAGGRRPAHAAAQKNLSPHKTFFSTLRSRTTHSAAVAAAAVPSLTLYYSPGACSLAAHVALHEASLPFEARRVLIAEAEHLAPEYLAVNPRGRIPTLVIDGTPVTELSAILGWIADRSPGLAPARGTLAAAQCAEWLGWFTSAVHISFALVWRGSRFIERAELHPELKAKGLATLKSAMPHADFTGFEKDPDVSKMPNLFTVKTIVNYVTTKMA